ncbi:hypothetical protein [Paracoccus hibiscisoli]|uniref:hypothetical protein n=1 Tax=Paracoccus hibiscisoli TaxID=2023261 RepID=UPI0023F066F2|nr:hypothetical protein [Paracoccus hibiscisoli]
MSNDFPFNSCRIGLSGPTTQSVVATPFHTADQSVGLCAVSINTPGTPAADITGQV